jgi:N-acetylglucosamine-6-phosphate deacetylase
MPDYFDLQVNGFGGIDFNSDELTLEQIEAACAQLRAVGVPRILATVITAPVEAMCRRIEKLARAINERLLVQQAIVGIHVEGPFISAQPGYVGAHPRAAVIPADLRVCQQLCAAGEGLVRLVTLAPEVDHDWQLIRFLHAQQIVIAAGHTDATRDELRGAIDAGLSMFTHLGNGCPLTMARHDQIINRVLSLADQLTISLIADNRHLPDFVLRLYLELIPDENIVIVSDSISAAGLGPGEFPLGGQMIRVDESGIAWAADGKHMAGSTGILSEMAGGLVRDHGFPLDRVRQWTCDNPNRLIV